MRASLDQHVLTALSQCRMMPGSWPKRFVRDLLADGDKDLTPRQQAVLWKLAYQFRRQIGGRSKVLADMAVTRAAAVDEWKQAEEWARPFEKVLSEDPDDWAQRLVYADALDERGLAWPALVQRWMAARRLRPLALYGADLLAGNYSWRWPPAATVNRPGSPLLSLFPEEASASFTTRLRAEETLRLRMEHRWLVAPVAAAEIAWWRAITSR